VFDTSTFAAAVLELPILFGLAWLLRRASLPERKKRAPILTAGMKREAPATAPATTRRRSRLAGGRYVGNETSRGVAAVEAFLGGVAVVDDDDDTAAS
jgi:hypothetical protein